MKGGEPFKGVVRFRAWHLSFRAWHVSFRDGAGVLGLSKRVCAQGADVGVGVGVDVGVGVGVGVGAGGVVGVVVGVDVGVGAGEAAWLLFPAKHIRRSSVRLQSSAASTQAPGRR